jgi:phospholipase C
VEGRYYCGTGKFDNFLHLWGPLSGPLFGYKYDSISLPISQFYQDCAAGTLPAVSFVDPVFTFFNCFDRETPGNDDHPHADIRNGEQFMASIYNAVISSPNWPNTILIINFDEWGGFFDHVAPTVAEVPQQEQAAYADVGIQPTNPTYGLRGFRVPCLVISPWARRGHVAHQEFDHTSVLKLIENRWRLPPLTVRDQNANDLADVLDFDHPDFTPPTPVMPPLGPWGGPCMELRTERRADGSLLIIWDHDTTCWRIMLQTAPEMRGPWMDIPSATSPFTVNPATSQHWFRFRVL